MNALETTPCPTCKGSGLVTHTNFHPYGEIVVEETRQDFCDCEHGQWLESMEAKAEEFAHGPDLLRDLNSYPAKVEAAS